MNTEVMSSMEALESNSKYEGRLWRTLQFCLCNGCEAATIMERAAYYDCAPLVRPMLHGRPVCVTLVLLHALRTFSKH